MGVIQFLSSILHTLFDGDNENAKKREHHYPS